MIDTGEIWGFLIGLVLGAVIGMALTALMIASSEDPEDRDGGEWPDGG